MDLEHSGPVRIGQAIRVEEQGPAEFGRKVVVGVADTILGRGLSTVVSLGSTLVLARLLGPEPYGILGMATVLTGLFTVINDAGLAVSVVQKREVTDSEMNSVFWLQLLMSVVVVVVTMLCAPILGWFYGRSEVTWVVIALAPTFVILAGFLQHRALLRRRMAYRNLAAIHLFTVVGSASVGIGAALLGAGYWSLVIKELSNYVLSLVAFWWAEPWRPGRPSVASDVRYHVNFSKWFFASKVIQFLSRSLDRLLLGHYFGAQTVGFYERSNAILYPPIGQLAMPLSSVVSPSLARVQDEPHRFRRLFLEALRMLAWVCLPLSGFFVLAAEDLVGWLLGDEWLPSVPLFTLIGAAVGLRAMDVSRVWLLTPLGRTQRMFRYTVAASALLVVVVVFTAARGAEAVAGARAVAVAVTFAAGMVYAAYDSPVTAKDGFRVVLVPGLVGFAIAASRWSGLWPEVEGHAVRLAVYATGSVALVVAAALVTGTHRRFFEALRLLRSKGTRST